MPEFELDLRNVESEVVDGVTVVKAAEVTAVSLGGLSAEEFVAPGAAERITAWAQPVSAEEACANVRKFVEAASAAMESNRLAERPPFEVVKHGRRRSCASCGFHQATHIGVMAEAQHLCRRDGVTYLIMWPRG